MLMSCPSLARDQFGLFFFLFSSDRQSVSAPVASQTHSTPVGILSNGSREKNTTCLSNTHTYIRVSFRRSREQVVASCVLVTTSRCSSEYLQALVTNNVIESRSWDRRATGSALPVFVLPASLIAYSLLARSWSGNDARNNRRIFDGSEQAAARAIARNVAVASHHSYSRDSSEIASRSIVPFGW